jgi:hypothetical protein
MGLQKYRDDFSDAKQADGSVVFYSKWTGGPTLAIIRDCPIQNLKNISPRTVYARGEPDTYFSIPGACEVKGKTITGYITSENGMYVFYAHKEFVSKFLVEEKG